MVISEEKNSLGKLFTDNYLGGSIFYLSIEKIADFYEQNYSRLSTEAVESFLKSLGIPSKYFLKQPFDTQMELLQNNISFISSDKSLFYFELNGSIKYVAIHNDRVFFELLQRTPVSKDWAFLGESFKEGYVRYFMPEPAISSEDSVILSKSEYAFGVFIDYPILLGKPMMVSVGFHKVPNQDLPNGASYIIPNTVVKLKVSKLPETTHNTYFEDLLRDAIGANADSVLDSLENHNLDSMVLMSMLERAIEDKTLNKGIAKKILRYVEKEDVSVSNRLDVAELVYSFVHETKSISSEMKFKQDILTFTLGSLKLLPDFSFIQFFKEGY